MKTLQAIRTVRPQGCVDVRLLEVDITISTPNGEKKTIKLTGAKASAFLRAQKALVVFGD